MTRIYKAIWTPLMLAGIVPGLLLLAVLAASLATQSFSLADDHVSVAASIGRHSVTYQGVSNTLPPHSGRAHPFLPLTRWVLNIGT